LVANIRNWHHTVSWKKTDDPPDEALLEMNDSDEDEDELPGQEINNVTVTPHNIVQRKLSKNG
jgi:hypothetical protein